MRLFFVVVGRGISVSAKDGGKDRLGCANIVADSALFVEKSLEFVKNGSFSRYVEWKILLRCYLLC